jgi:hypothetical protein
VANSLIFFLTCINISTVLAGISLRLFTLLIKAVICSPPFCFSEHLRESGKSLRLEKDGNTLDIKVLISHAIEILK